MIGSKDARSAFASGLDRPAPGLDLWLLASAGVLLFLGLTSLRSLDLAVSGGFFAKQVVFALVGVGVMAVVARVPHDRLQRVAPALYLVNLLALVSVLVVGSERKGATRWIDLGPLQFQPSELGKLLVIVTLAAFFATRTERARDFKVFLGSLLHVAPIVVLVLLQPHLAGAISIVVIWLALAVAFGTPWRFVVGSVLAVVALLGLAWVTPGVMPDYMRSRIEGKLNPDTQANAYQQDRAKIAIGVGGVVGAGFGRGEQKAARFVPEQENDFVFTVIGEEGGLIGAGLTLAAFGFFFFRVWMVGWRSSDPFSRLCANGVLAVLGFHTVVNLGMNVGLLPVAGLWLPFMSSGGTALWMCMASVGLLLGSR